MNWLRRGSPYFSRVADSSSAMSFRRLAGLFSSAPEGGLPRRILWVYNNVLNPVTSLPVNPISSSSSLARSGAYAVYDL